MFTGRSVLGAARRYLSTHPEELARVIRSSFGLRFGVPLAVFRWMIQQLADNADDLDVELAAEPPGLRFGASLDKMDTTLRLSGVLYIARINVNADEIRIELRLDRVKIRVLSEKKTVVSALVRSGALDITRIGDLIHELPGIPPFIAEARNDRIVLDLMRAPALGENPWLRHAVGMMSSLITVHGVETESSDHLDVVLRALPRGTVNAVGALRSHLLGPGARRVSDVLGLQEPRHLATVP
jgi:hypothetical protein